MTASPGAGFIRNGWRELGRKWERRKLAQQLREQVRQREAALTDLGQNAWQEKIDLSAFPDLREQLSRLDAQAGDLSTAAKTLDAERAALEERRSTEAAKFDGQQRATEEQKQPVDVALRSARDRHAVRTRTLQQLETRSAALSSELATLGARIAALATSALPESQSQLAAAQTRQQQLLAEQRQLTTDVPRAQAEIPESAAEVNRLAAESQRHAEAIAQIQAARKAALAEIDGPLEKARAQLRSSQQQATAVQQERSGRFAALGLALYGQKVEAAALSTHMQRVTSVDQRSAEAQAAMQASLAQTQSMPQNTMLKFFAVLLLIAGSLAAVTFAATTGTYPGWNPLQSSTTSERREGSGRSKRNCEPLRRACDRLRNWKDCVQSRLTALMTDTAEAAGLLAAESAARSSTPEQAAIWQPQYLVLTQQLNDLVPFFSSLQAEAASSVAVAMADCALLPGPEDPRQCREAAERVEDALKKAREKLERDLDAKLTAFNSITQAQGAGWASIGALQAKLQIRQAEIKQCSR